jgi:hypothetical protein
MVLVTLQQNAAFRRRPHKLVTRPAQVKNRAVT